MKWNEMKWNVMNESFRTIIYTINNRIHHIYS